MTQELGALREDIEPIGLERGGGWGSQRGGWIVALSLLFLGGLFTLGYLPKIAQRERLDAQAGRKAEQLPRVALIQPARVELPRVLSLPGNIQGLEETTVYARADGFVAELAADMGDQVRAGQLLAALDNPEVDREIEQARANLASSEAQLLRSQAAQQNSLANLKRYQVLQPGLASQEQIDQKRTQTELDEADVGVARAAREASRANLDRLLQVKAFSRVLAPFAGTITARSVERGALARGKDSPLFKITSLETVRIFVQVPQSRVAGIEPGQRARLGVAEYPGGKFEGRVTRTSGSLDPRSRTMNVEIRVPNPQHQLLPGMYATVTLEFERSGTVLVVPATALITGEKGVRVASVDAQGRVHLLPIEIARDRGPDVEIASGLSGEESIIASPGPAIADDALVQTDNARNPKLAATQ